VLNSFSLVSYAVYLLCFMSLCVFFICFYLTVCCFSVIWALLPEINVMMMMMMITYRSEIPMTSFNCVSTGTMSQQFYKFVSVVLAFVPAL